MRTQAEATPDCAPPPRVAERPDAPLPPGTCDTHVHVFGPQSRYPLARGRNYTPHVCTLDAYREVMLALGISRAVLVQPSVYGTDNSALLDALRAGGPAFRGIVVPDPGTSDEQLREMHALGVRGIRLNLVNPHVLGVEEAVALCARVESLGWHLQVQLDLARGDGRALQALCDSTRLPVVVDHMGRLAPQARRNELIDLLAAGRCWVKLSAPYRVSAQPAPHADLSGLVQAFAKANPAQLLWGSDWPHTEQQADTPQAASLADLLHLWFPDAPAMRRVCVDNPARLYNYPKEDSA
ncbi:MAG: amidohydrolase family protein [Ramlibacter sp.]